ncbi:kinase-like domain-containing protein [Scenedesmus sp. NREL 46B-D3]|nr:kinase-like domain-containing protein [Scenedesmus sp. NREL 46B-D3]
MNIREPAARVMGNTYSSAKPSLPALNLSKVKHTPDKPDDLYIGSSHPQRNVVSLSSARLPGTARKLPPAQQLMSTQDGSAGPGTMEQQTGRIANNIVPKPQVPALNLSRHGDGFGSDQSLTARVPGHGPGSLPHVQRGANTSRTAAFGAAAAAAAGVQQQYGSDTIRPSPAVETGPITPAQALKRYGEYLTAYEQSEILQYQHIWFLGKADVQKIKGNPHLQKTNYGYDDERGDYHVTPRDHIAYRYEVQSVLGKGSFGQVLKVLDYKTGSYKALKVIRNKKRFHHQAQVELKVLEHLRQQDPEDAHHVIHIQEHFTFRNHLCITFELLSINLYEFIKQNNFAGLSLQLIKRFAAQMLVSLKFLRRQKLIHCDLKPENVLLVAPQRSAIKVIDFGSSCFVDEQMYTYVQSRFYRSPEVILGLPYGCEIDMWSFGCILAELFMGYPLFPASRRKIFFDSSGNPTIVANSRGKVRNPGSKSLWSVLRCQDPGFVDFMEKCLRWDPAERLTPEQAMAHPWMQDQMPNSPGSFRHSSRSRQDQAQAPGSGKLQPTSVMAAAAAALSASGAVGKAAAKAVGIPLNTRSNSGALCSAECRDTAVPAQHNFTMGVPAAAAAVAGGAPTWQQPGVQQMQVDANAAGAVSHTPRALAAAPLNDTSQSGIDCTPRQHSGTSAGAAGMGAAGHGTLSAAAPVVTTGGSTAGRRSIGGAGFTPRAMETDAPGLGSKQVYGGTLVTKQQVGQGMVNMNMVQHQQQAAYALLHRQQVAVAAAMQQQLQDGAWAEQQQAAPQQLDMTPSGAASRAAAASMSNATTLNQQLLLQQLLQQQELAAGLNQQVQSMQSGQEHFGGPGAVMGDRVLPRLQR